MPPGEPLAAPQTRLLRDVAAHTGLVLRNVSLLADLRASRQRIVTAQDERARKLERDIHDGAQQQLVALSVKLRLAEQLISTDPPKARDTVASVREDAADALETLRDLARGIYPPLLADQGLAVALESQARKLPVPAAVEADGIGRYSQEVEATAYFCALEALQNVTKYALANRVSISLFERDGVLRFDVQDDGVGFDPAVARGSGLANMRDRVEAVGGRLDVRSVIGEGTTVAGWVPATGWEVPS
jgi:signal transduction histidine kinase